MPTLGSKPARCRRAGEVGEQRAHEVRDRLGDGGRREELVGQREVVGDEARRELVGITASIDRPPQPL
jgi:hypothetical protein